MQLDPQTKQQLEQTFIFKSILGKGSFGCVYECEDKRDGQIYAVKVISKGNVKKNRIECLREQARLLSNINHPNIVKVNEFVETDTFIFLRMETIRNGTLQKFIKDRWASGRKLNDEEMAAVMVAIFRSLHHIHSLNIIHRDIKPENILLPSLDDLGQAKMADFGLSTKLDFYYPKTATSKCGTMLYMAPEILNNLSYTKSVDVWSCSIIMYMLAQGRHPFFQPKMTSEEYKRRIKTVVFPPLPNALAQNFIAHISKVEANERYTTQQALNHPWLTRNFDDEIPQSLHQSFLGFEKSHTLSNAPIFKLLLSAKNICQGPQLPAIPESYILKKDEQSSYFLSLNLKKVKSNKLLDKKTLLNISTKSTIKENIKQTNENRPWKQYEKDNNPAIAKLNAIFDSLLERKPRNKERYNQFEKFKDKNNGKMAEESPPKHMPFKEKLENQIEKLVRQFKGEEALRTTANLCGLKRMLPHNKKKVSSKKAQKDEFRLSTDSSTGSTKNSSLFKIRHHKKSGIVMRFYD